MTFVGKMLVVVQVVLSIAFMAFAGGVYSIQQSWKAEAAKLQSQVDSLKSDLADQSTSLQLKLDQAEQARAAAEQRANQAEGINAQLQAQLANEQQRTNQLNLQNNQLQGLAEAKSDEATYRLEEAQRERVAAQALRQQVNELQTGLRDRDDQIFAMQLQLDDLTSRFNTLVAENGDLKKVLRLNNLSDDPAELRALEEPPPPIDGVVVATKSDRTNRTSAVEISVGSDDGVRKNHVLDVYSTEATGGKTRYLGKIRIMTVTPDRAVGYVIESSKNGIIQRGDNVTTRL